MTEVLLLGRSIPALAAALEMAEVGITVRIAHAEPRVPLGEVRDAHGAVAQLLAEIAAPLTNGGGANPAAAPVRSDARATLLAAKDGSLRLPPTPEVWGVPTLALSAESLAFLGTRTALRLYLDRLKPVLTIGKEENLAKLVRSRIGAAALDLLVEPRVFERFGVFAAEAEVPIAVPGLDEAITRAGSLTGAAAWLLDAHREREALVAPAEGWLEFCERLLARLSLYGAEHIDREELERDGIEDRFAATIVDVSIETGGDADELRPTRLRSYARVGIQEPARLADDSETIDSLRLASDSNGRTWAVRTRRGQGGEWIAELSGPSASAPGLDPADASPGDAASDADVLGNVLDGLGIVASDAPRIRLAAAPYATRAQRDAGMSVLDAWHERHPDRLAAGEAAHGDDLGAALLDARRRAVHLRRRILGLED